MCDPSVEHIVKDDDAPLCGADDVIIDPLDRDGVEVVIIVIIFLDRLKVVDKVLDEELIRVCDPLVVRDTNDSAVTTIENDESVRVVWGCSRASVAHIFLSGW
jgi:hypothetical protein